MEYYIGINKFPLKNSKKEHSIDFYSFLRDFLDLNHLNLFKMSILQT